MYPFSPLAGENPHQQDRFNFTGGFSTPKGGLLSGRREVKNQSEIIPAKQGRARYSLKLRTGRLGSQQFDSPKIGEQLQRPKEAHGQRGDNAAKRNI